MKYNSILEQSIVSLVGGTEYVVLDDLKMELNLLFTSSGTPDFSDDDDYLTALIPQARSVIEEYTGLALTSMNVAVVIRNECGNTELPYGPFVSLTAIKDADGNDISSADYTLQGKWFKKLKEPLYDYVELTYKTGYCKDTETSATPLLPQALKRAWLEQAVWMYNHRGEEKGFDICEAAMNSAAPFVRKSILA